MRRYKIGYLISQGFSEADMIAMQAPLGAHSHKSFTIAPSMDAVVGSKGFVFVPDVDFTSCPDLDIIVIGGLHEDTLKDQNFLDFLKQTVSKTPYVVAGGSGIVACSNSGVLPEFPFEHNDTHNPPKGHIKVQDKFYIGESLTAMVEAAFDLLGVLRGRWYGRFIELTLEYDPHAQFGDKETTLSSLSARNVPKGPTIAVIVPSGAYLPDVMGAMEVISSIPGSKVHVVSKDTSVLKCLMGPKIKPQQTYATCPDADIVIIGATRPKILKDKELLGFIRNREPKAKAMVSVCAGTLIYAAAGILDGKKATSNFHHTPLLRPLGAIPTGTEVAVDQKFYTAGPAIGSYELGLRLVGDLYGEEIARYIEQSVLKYQPNPVFNTGSPEKAGKLMTWTSKLLGAASLPFYLHAGKAGRRSIKPA